jgi:hypothetical protein
MVDHDNFFSESDMKFTAVDAVLSAAKDWHLPISVFIFIVGSVMKWFGHLDSTFVAFTATVLGAITGHSFSPAQKDHEEEHHDH